MHGETVEERASHCGNRCRFVYAPEYYCDIGAHVFPMEKFRLVREALLIDPDIDEGAFLLPEEADDIALLRAHTEAYVDDLRCLRKSERTASSELPLSKEIVRAFRMAAGGSLLACRWALEHGVAMNLAGGFHHAFADHAEGFCYINDVAVAIRGLIAEGGISRALVVDLDVHQGNGTAVIFEDDPAVFTFSLHQENNYPAKRRSDCDVGLADGMGDAEYVHLLDENLGRILDSHQPDLVVYLAGADPYEKDQLGGLALTLDGLHRRDACVVDHCLGRRVPLAAVLAGGYALDVHDTVRIHHATARLLWEAGRMGRDGALSTE
jgi:acetoin utilization deacetylase AcuC-like enzyme